MTAKEECQAAIAAAAEIIRNPAPLDRVRRAMAEGALEVAIERLGKLVVAKPKRGGKGAEVKE